MPPLNPTIAIAKAIDLPAPLMDSEDSACPRHAVPIRAKHHFTSDQLPVLHVARRSLQGRALGPGQPGLRIDSQSWRSTASIAVIDPLPPLEVALSHQSLVLEAKPLSEPNDACVVAHRRQGDHLHAVDRQRGEDPL